MATKGGGRNSSTGSTGGTGGTGGKDDRRARRAEAVAVMKREQARRETRSRLLMAGGVVVAVLIVVAVGVYVGVTRPSPATAAGREDAPASVVKDVTSIPSSVFDKVATGNTISAPSATSKADGGATTTPFEVDGKPYFLYIGAEYCPYCAAERWAMAAALGRFGTFTGLKETESSATDVDPKTQTLSFYKSTYTSKYVTFKAVETETNTGTTLETPTGTDAKLEQKYDYPPYVSGQGGSIPFVDIANTYVSSGATLDVSVLQGKSHAQIAAAMQDPDTAIAKAVDGAANLFAAAICNTTGGQPGAVCDTSGVKAGQAELKDAATTSGNSSSQ